jgi:hypothetical protein
MLSYYDEFTLQNCSLHTTDDIFRFMPGKAVRSVKQGKEFYQAPSKQKQSTAILTQYQGLYFMLRLKLRSFHIQCIGCGMNVVLNLLKMVLHKTETYIRIN